VTIRHTAIGLVSGKTYVDVSTIKQNRKAVLLSSPLKSNTSGPNFCIMANPDYAAEIELDTSEINKVLLREYSLDPNAVFRHTSLPLPQEVFLATSPQFSYCNTRLSDLVCLPPFKIARVAKETV